ncbi:MAG: bifunctional 4-hydroxy-2-oxoglutarate aldolase/2-dehydro-3-deoxy-phosphogluconate aldolase [Bacteroidota bacterium]
MSFNAPFSRDKFLRAPIVGIARGLPTTVLLHAANALREAGLFTLEVTMNSPEVVASIRTLRDEFPELNVGAGTVCHAADLVRAVDAGAQFIVTPIVAEAVITGAVERRIPVFPGAYTPTEIYRAASLGAEAVKVFPAGQLGVGYLKNVAAPLDQIRLLPTGGVNLDNIASFFAAGAVGVGMGSSLLDKSLIAKEDFAGLTRHCERVLAAIPSRAED